MNSDRSVLHRLDQIDRFPLCHLPTPLQPLDRLSATLGGPRLWIKRDDCTGLSLGGNKSRKMEYVIPEVIASGADTLVTIGALQSNHVRQTIAAGVRSGMESWVVLGNWVGHEHASYLRSGNRLLDEVLGARIFTAGDDETPDDALSRVCDAAIAAGRKPSIVALGASTPVGALGYAHSAVELLQQCEAEGFKPAAVYFASGSGGTQAGLLAGMLAAKARTIVQGISVFNANGQELLGVIESICAETLKLLGDATEIASDDLRLDETQLGPGYGQPTDEMLEALRLLARLEAVILDPVYTAKAMAGLIKDLREERFGADENIVFIHTGGAPGLFAYADIIDF